MVKRFPAQVIACALIAMTYVAHAQAGGQVVTRTRLVTEFSQLQSQWLDAVRKKDSTTLDKLLADEYQVWTPTRSDPIPRDEWQEQAFRKELKSDRFRDMAVRAVTETVAVESFLLEEEVLRAGKASAERYFVVNVWTKTGDGWRCTDTYISPVAITPEPVRPH